MCGTHLNISLNPFHFHGIFLSAVILNHAKRTHQTKIELKQIAKQKTAVGKRGIEIKKESEWERERERKKAKHTFSNYKSFLMKTPSSNSSSSLHQPLTRRNCLHTKSELMNCWDAFTTLRNQKISIGWKMEKNRIYFCVDKVSNFRQ